MSNTFSNDGSFMEQFLKKQKLTEGGETTPSSENKESHFDAATFYNQPGLENSNSNYNHYYQQYPQQTGGTAGEGEYNNQYYNYYNQQGSYYQQNQQYNQPPPPPPQYGGSQNHQYQQTSQPGQQPTKVLWAGNVHPDVMEEELRHIFSPFGYIELIKILRNKQYAFITYSETASAIKAQSVVNNQMLKGYPLKLGFGKEENIPSQTIVKKEDDIPTKNLWLGNVHATVSNDMLRQAFEPFGRIEGIHILSHRGCAFVNFNNVDAAMNARSELNGHILCGMPLKINFRKENEHFSNRGGGGGGSGGGFHENRGNDYNQQPQQRDRNDSHQPPPRRSDRPQRSFTRGETVPTPAPPPNSLKEQQAIDTIAEYIAKNGPKLESMIMERQSNTNFFNFLKPDQPNYDYYRWKLWTIKNPDTHSSNNSNTNNHEKEQFNPQFPSDFLNEMQVSEFKSILEKLNSTNTQSCKSWIINHVSNALEIISIITTTHQNNQLSFPHKLNILQVLNDCLQSTLVKRENKDSLDQFANIIKPYLPFLIYSTGSNESAENQEKIVKILSGWEFQAIYPNDFIEELKGALQPDDEKN